LVGELVNACRAEIDDGIRGAECGGMPSYQAQGDGVNMVNQEHGFGTATDKHIANELSGMRDSIANISRVIAGLTGFPRRLDL
jgi:hypothetical protein